MMIELQATYFVLKKWKPEPRCDLRGRSASGSTGQETEDNHRPLAEVEVERMKAFLRQYAPTSYFEIFAKEKTDR